MAWWEWIPVVSTIGHAAADPKGRKITDYASCACTPAGCASGAAIAITKCSKCIDALMLKYIGDWIGTPLASDFFKAAGGLTLAAVSEKLGKELAKKGAGKVAAAATGVGAIVTLDGFVDAGIVITKAVQIYNASQTAKTVYCVCPAPPPPPPPPGGTGTGAGAGTGTNTGADSGENAEEQ
jgi:hypothetical protein